MASQADHLREAERWLKKAERAVLGDVFPGTTQSMGFNQDLELAHIYAQIAQTHAILATNLRKGVIDA
jgi:hypothetical protein